MQPASVAPHYQYTWDYACPGAAPGSANTPLCAAAIMACSGGAGGGGPQIIIWQRQVAPSVSGWNSIGTSCDPNAVPADSPPAGPGAPPPPPPPPPRPVLTMAMILDAFNRTQFAVPTTTVQPKGGATLVRLPVYLQVTWPQAGFEPGEVNQVPAGQMLGYDVRIKPVLQSVTYSLGDGATIGPTQDLGGPYPTGTVTHPYTKAGRFTQRTSVTYGGEVSVNGGPFTPITGTATLTGPAQAVTVKTATNQLVR